MNAILIDPENKTISKISNFKNDVNYILSTIGNGCDSFNRFSFGTFEEKNIDLIIDDKAPLRDGLTGAFMISHLKYRRRPATLEIMNRAIICCPIMDPAFDRLFKLLEQKIEWLSAEDL